MAWHPENKKAIEGAFAHGLKTGPWKQWDDQEGTAIVEGSYARDRRAGLWIFRLAPEAPFQKNYDTALDCAALWGKKRWSVRPGACFGGIGLNTTPGDLAAVFGEKEVMVQTLRPRASSGRRPTPIFFPSPRNKPPWSGAPWGNR